MITYKSDEQLKAMSLKELEGHWTEVEDYRTSDEFPRVKATKLREYGDKVFETIYSKRGWS